MALSTTANNLQSPKNIHLLFIPPYSPELNPAELIWKFIKDKMANTIFENIQQLSDKLCEIIQVLDKKIIQAITGWHLYKNRII